MRHLRELCGFASLRKRSRQFFFSVASLVSPVAPHLQRHHELSIATRATRLTSERSCASAVFHRPVRAVRAKLNELCVLLPQFSWVLINPLYFSVVSTARLGEREASRLHGMWICK